MTHNLLNFKIPQPNILTKHLFTVELAGEDIRAAVVSRRGRGFEVLDFAAMKRPDPQDDLPAVEVLKALSQRLGRNEGPAVLVTPLARAFELLMDRKKIAAMKHYQLLEAVRWEVEPYTGITGASALIGVTPEILPESTPGEIIPEEESPQTTLTVAAIERNVYRAARERFKAAGFSLARIYPPETTFYCALLMEPSNAPRALLEVGQDYSNFALLRGGVPDQINTLSISLEAITAHLSGEMPSEELVDTLRFTIRQSPETEPLIISGAGAVNQAVIDFIAGFCPAGARALSIDRSAGIADAKDETAHAVFGAVVGAAVRELKGKQERRAGIDDAIPLALRLKKSAYMVPVAATIVILALLTGHFQYMKFKDRVYKSRMKALKTELKSRKAEIAEYENLITQRDDLKKDIALMKKRLAYMEDRADENLACLAGCLQGLADGIPDRMVLSRIVQSDGETYGVTGTASELSAVGDYATQLQETEWCKAAVIDKLEKGGISGQLEFEITIHIREDAA